MANEQPEILGNIVFAALWIALLADIILRAVWNRFYFAIGAPIFIMRLPVKNDYQGVPYQYFFDEEFDSLWFASLAFKAIDSRSYGFREKYFQPRLLKYMPVMHGLIIFEQDKKRVVVKGMANWFVLWLILYFSLAQLDLLASFPINIVNPTSFIVVVFLAFYIIQCVIFSKVGRFAADLCSNQYALTSVRV
jgi:hypothetical protein